MVSITSITHLLEEIFRGKVEIEEEIGSSVNHTYLISAQNIEYIAKFMTRDPLNQVEQYRFLKTEYVLNLLADKAVPVPKIIHVDNTVHEYDDFKIYSILIFEKLNSDPVDVIWSGLTPKEKSDFTLEFAKMLSTIHSVEFSQFGDIDIPEHPIAGQRSTTWVGYVRERIHEASEKIQNGDIMDGTLISQAVQFIEDHTSVWDYRGTPRLVHRDIWKGNFLMGDSKIYLLDWEWCMAGDPDMDLLWIESEFFKNDNPHLVDLFFEVYNQRCRSSLSDMKRRLYGVYFQLMTAAFGFVAHNPSDDAFRRTEKLLQHYIHGTPRAEIEGE